MICTRKNRVRSFLPILPVLPTTDDLVFYDVVWYAARGDESATEGAVRMCRMLPLSFRSPA